MTFKTHRSRLFSLTTSATVLTLSLLFSIDTYAASQQELKGVTSEIQRQKQSLSQQQKELDELQQALKKQELDIASQKKQIEETKQQQNKANQNIAQLQKKIAQLETQRKKQTDILTKLMQTYYITKRATASGNLLNTGVEEDRISQYYQHLAKSRTQAIQTLEQTHQELDDSEHQLKLERDQITSLLEQQTKKYQELANSQQQRHSTISKIQKGISGDKVYLAELQRNETRLKAEIAKAAKRNAVPMDGLARQKGKLPWPIKGSLLHRYGDYQGGQINWKGIVISANYGEPVKAIYPGTVVFSDYLRGYGLMVLIDHGRGDMTLYGFNQALTKKEGDKVSAGETIALAGDTGGQPQPAVYFEVRRNSQAENPLSWLSR
ncbi:murein hydrolase activator EnvC family protein [Vibrio porteresiae]|uniref:Murein hydrolase activator EnvC n=1 Tax=Vibrio porteresiae DSM 19223 TaxID=1123496 RepID=A0ABZ0QF41_9VIBR|nr:murein hydrolase activator EnvC [Vibrio porteresiae]WPC74377.1 murein hydrolase activator EnvC [Vibrio porteresiae DSM 19223]